MVAAAYGLPAATAAGLGAPPRPIDGEGERVLRRRGVPPPPPRGVAPPLWAMLSTIWLSSLCLRSSCSMASLISAWGDR
jgi:hypothetical protein